MSREPPTQSDVPGEEPPPYSEIAEGGNVSVDQGAGVHEIRRWDVQTNRPLNATATGASNTTQSSASGRPPAPLPVEDHRPPPGPPPGHKPYRPPPGPPPSSSRPHPDEKSRPPPGPPPSHRPSQSRPSSSHLGPPPPAPGRPSSVHSSHSGNSSSTSYSGNWQAPYSQNLPPQWPPAQANPHLNYPPGYFCKKCHNTGVKVKKGTTCKDCYEKFGVRTQAQYLPPGVMPVFPVAPRVVMPGDPSIGGALCGRCRGAGVIHDLFIFEDTCPVCHGVGRVF